MKNMLLSIALLTCVATASAAIRVTGAAYLNGEKLGEQEYVLNNEDATNRISVDLDNGHVDVSVVPSEDNEHVTLELTVSHRAENGDLQEMGTQQATVKWGQEAIFSCEGAPANLSLKAVRE